MATVPSASPRPSLSILGSPSSSRTSLDHGSNPSAPSSLSRAANAAGRRNRTALRDYYGLKAPPPDGGSVDQNGLGPQAMSPGGGSAVSASRLNALDRDGFDAGGYVRQVLETESLKGLLGLENELVGEVKSLDGERKALVYDNYSKLISATDTIKKMRSNMDPLAPATSTLAPAIAHIAETSVSLANELDKQSMDDQNAERIRKERQLQIIQRATQGPETLKLLVGEGRREEAAKEWEFIQKILDRLHSIPGCQEVRASCEKVMEETDMS